MHSPSPRHQELAICLYLFQSFCMSLYRPFTPYHLRQVLRSSPDWVLEGLIMMGDQVILSGAPKSYKSFLASHLATALASGSENFLSWRIPRQRKVLYISLEMTAEQTAERVLKQLDALIPDEVPPEPSSIEGSSIFDDINATDISADDATDPTDSTEDYYDNENPLLDDPGDGSQFDFEENKWIKPFEEEEIREELERLEREYDLIKDRSPEEIRLGNIPLIHVFNVNGRHSVDVLDDEQKNAPSFSSWASLHKIISDIDPEVVIFDSLVRFFNGDENSNPVMSKVMQCMRSLCAFPKERDNGDKASSYSS